MEKGFRRTALSLIVISVVTALVAAVYLYYNFNSRSNLPLIVPGDVDWCYHFQTREIKKTVKGQPPAYFDSLVKTIKRLPVLSGVRDAGEPGMALYSDLVIFRNQHGWFAGLTVSSESRLRKYCEGLPAQGFSGPVVEKNECYYVRSRTRNLYFAFRHKACVFFVPSDTAMSAMAAEAAILPLFRENPKPLINRPEMQELYDGGCQVIYFNNRREGLLTHGVRLDKPVAEFMWRDQKPGSAAPSPLSLFRAAGEQYSETDVEGLIDKQNRIGTNEYLNQSFKVAVRYLQPFIK